ncbi:MAG: phage head closure protein [Candidatus Thiodiazotropha sp. (ex Epidulcina cf. delphinae)]|nr:phage head closure protein [Candidatus Thiodiazotropha sp. (ex Epidulcina cf. delphinae)]
MISGNLRHKITIQRATVTRSNSGQAVKNWGDVATVRADVYSISGREFFDADQVNSDVTLKVVVRFINGIDPGMRVVHNRRIYDIKAVLNQENRRRPTLLMCSYKGEQMASDMFADNYWAANYWHANYWMNR